MKDPRELTDKEVSRERTRLVKAWADAKLSGDDWKHTPDDHDLLLRVTHEWHMRRQKRWAHLKDVGNK